MTQTNPPDAASEVPAVSESLPWSVASSSLLTKGDRRFEARSYLTDGYGIRQLIEAQRAKWSPLNDLASIWQPSRLKGVVVPEGLGVPFLSAGQVLEARPRVRKWLARSKTPDLALRTVKEDWLLLSRSGTVGRLTAVYPHHLNVVITDDLLRVVPHSESDYGWLYAYLKTPHFRSIAQSAQYGHMIKHLEVEHVSSMPVILPSQEVRDRCTQLVREMIAKRRRSLSLRTEAEERYAVLLGVGRAAFAATNALHTSVGNAVLRQGRRRLDAAFFSPGVVTIEKLIADADTTSVDTVGEVCTSVRLGSRFKRFFGPNGTPYRSAEELFDLNSPVTKRIYAGLVENARDYMLRKGWIAMACSGQVYGLNGQAMLLGPGHDGIFGSHDLIRIVPDTTVIAAGYLVTVLTHPVLGRPMVTRNAYGTSIPHLDPVDVRDVPVPRFKPEAEEAIAELATEAASLRDAADAQENEAVELATRAITDFTHR